MDIDVSLVTRLIESQFPQWAHFHIKPVELSGWDSRTFRLGEDMTIRLPSQSAYAAQVEKEQQWLPRLAPLLPLTIPTPIAMGEPSDEYPWHWSIYQWIDGENATVERIADLNEFAVQLSQFLNDLYQIDASGGPASGPHNFYRGASLSVYDTETRSAIAHLGSRIDANTVTPIWEEALQSTWNAPPVWIHGDVHATNLLTKDGRLHAVIDFGCSGVGDPACDLTIAWTFFHGESREIFRSRLNVDDDTWSRARGWALWKGLITLADETHTDPLKVEAAHRVLNEVIHDDRQF